MQQQPNLQGRKTVKHPTEQGWVYCVAITIEARPMRDFKTRRLNEKCE